MAPPLKDIDPKKVYNLAGMGLTNVEIAATLDCCDETLVRRYAEQLQGGRERFTGSLRRMQYMNAKKGSTSMLVWLGKQYLGQTDKVTHKVEDGGSVSVTIRRTEPNAGNPGS